VIDDDIGTLELLALTLRKAGYKVYLAASYEGVIDQIEYFNQQKEQFDLILLDLMMPGRSGYDMLDTLKVILRPMPPVIILSALSGLGDAVKALELGATKYVTKPTTPDKLLMTISEVLREHRRKQY